jgi:hypothetical protein
LEISQIIGKTSMSFFGVALYTSKTEVIYARSIQDVEETAVGRALLLTAGAGGARGGQYSKAACFDPDHAGGALEALRWDKG